MYKVSPSTPSVSGIVISIDRLGSGASSFPRPTWKSAKTVVSARRSPETSVSLSQPASPMGPNPTGSVLGCGCGFLAELAAGGWAGWAAFPPGLGAALGVVAAGDETFGAALAPGGWATRDASCWARSTDEPEVSAPGGRAWRRGPGRGRRGPACAAGAGPG